MSGTSDAKRASKAGVGLTHSPYLLVLLECDRPLAGSARFALSGVDRVLLGRGDARAANPLRDRGMVTLDVRLPARSVSTRHARIIRMRDGWVLEDIGSRNGTFVNGKRIDRALLAPGDVFEIGQTLLAIDPEARARDDGPGEGEAPRAGELSAPATLDGELAAQFAVLARVAPTGVPVLVLGESGTGKEVLSRWVHALGNRRGELVALNCGAIPAGLVASQLFGHVRGAFSGAVRDAPGAFRAAHAGTLLLDEISDLPRESQATLLRALQEREVVPLGATRPVPVDVRVIAATAQPLAAMVERGEFRRDLYARLAGFVVHLPPLRERRCDLGLLIATLLTKVAPSRASRLTLAPDAGRALLAHTWPFNVRELEQCLAVATALADDGCVELAHLPPTVAAALDTWPAAPAALAPRPVSERDVRLRMELLAALEEHAGNLAEVAAAMGKARMQIHRWCKRFGIDPNLYRP
jgi:transcriptional regulator of acetoin/glycerol metabolism